MASELALQIAQRHLETTVTVGASRLASNVDAELSEVREALDGLSAWGTDGRRCWCPVVLEPHDDICQRTRELYEKLRT